MVRTRAPRTFEIDRAIRGVTPALSACRRPLHRRLWESEKPTMSPQRSPETREQVSRLFRRCDVFDWCFFGFGLFAMFIGVVQEPIDQPGAALLHNPPVLGLLPILENSVISLIAHGILHLRRPPTVKQLRNTVYSSELTTQRLGAASRVAWAQPYPSRPVDHHHDGCRRTRPTCSRA